MTPIIDHALGLVLDDPQCAAFTDERAAQILGRDAHEDKDDDPAWWEAKTKAVSELLDEMKSINAGGAQ
jgi:hypothetical protein